MPTVAVLPVPEQPPESLVVRLDLEFSGRVANVSTIVLDGARHEILLERDSHREQFWAAFKAFIHDQDPMVPL